MESRGFHLQHQLEEGNVQCVTSATLPDYKPSTGQLSWIPNNIYNGFLTESFTNSREIVPKHAMIDSLLITSSKGQGFGFHDGKNLTQQYSSSTNDDLPKQIEVMNSPIDGGIMALTKRYDNFGRRGGVSSSISSGLPTLDMTSSSVSCSLGLNSQMLDLHTSGYGGNCGLQLCCDTFGLTEHEITFSHSNSNMHMHGSENSPSNTSSKISSFISEVSRTKRHNNCSRPKESEAKAKKSRPSCPPLEVRKENLGDRIQTLQRLVAPSGKTNTASVLAEAIGYIHFLHEQIQTLTNPHMKSSQSKPSRMVHPDSKEEDGRKLKPDLRSRGLCLVPLSYASSIHHRA